MIRARIREWLRMCEHRGCLEIFVPLREGNWFGVWYLCEKHKYHAKYSDWDCSSGCNS